MSAILKAGAAPTHPFSTSVYQLSDLIAEASRVIEDARRQAQAIIADAQRQSEVLMENARKAGAQKGLQEGLSEGRIQGHTQALEQAQARFDEDIKQLAENLTKTVHEISAERTACLHQAEQDLLDFAVHIARRVTKSVGEMNGNVAEENLRSALALVMSQSDLSVKVHPHDLAALKRFARGLADQASSQPHITFVEDSTIARGGVIVSTADSEIDATLDEQLEQIVGALTQHARE